MSPHIKQYFETLQKEVEKVYNVAKIARAKGIDPSTEVESPPANDMADRVEQLVGPKGVSSRIHELQAAGKDQNDITFQVATEILDGKFGELSRAEAIERAIRAALAIKTEGVVSAPLEGISRVITREDGQGGEYLSIYFAGPIRAAGGTTAAFAVLITDYVRAHLNIPKFKASDREADRLVEEVKLYDRIMNLQYPSSNEEIRECYMNVPVEINGEATEDREVSAYRDVPRIETNFVRGGACLVLNDGLLAKASKLLKIIKEKNIPGWEWLKQLKEKVAHHQDQAAAEEPKAKEGEYGGGLYAGSKEVVVEKKSEKTEDLLLERRKILFEKYPPLSKYIADVIAGRPVFAYPSRIGGYRLRYGRSRNTGLAACGLHPASMAIVDDFCAIGTQTRIERPGKSSSTMPVDSIEGPIVLLKNGSVCQITSPDEAREIYPTVERILFLGDILLGFGEFVENNHKLAPSGYVEEWWIHHLRQAISGHPEAEWGGTSYTSELIKQINTDKNYFSIFPNAAQALEMCDRLGIPLHPKHLDFWGNLEPGEILELRNFLLQGELSSEIHLAKNARLKWLLEIAFVPHTLQEKTLVLSPEKTTIFKRLFNLEPKTARNPPPADTSVWGIFRHFSGMDIRDKAPIYIGMRMGRPEKAKERKMSPPVQVLFPLGHDSDSRRSVKTAAKTKSVTVDAVTKQCPQCRQRTFRNLCPTCQVRTEMILVCSRCGQDLHQKDMCPKCNARGVHHGNQEVDLGALIQNIQQSLNLKVPEIKGVKGMSSENKIPEPLEKGILRARNSVWVYKDGTIRYDSTNVPITHFIPREIKTPIERLHTLGYTLDCDGVPLTSDDQVCELLVQDILIPHHTAEYFLQVARFVDEELQYIYGLPPFYNLKEKDDLVGVIFAGLAPHTSAAIIGRVIGFTKAYSGYAHPFWHAAKRRNCFPGDSTILVEINGSITRISLKSLYEDLFTNENQENLVFTKNKPTKTIKVISFSQKENKTVYTDIVDVIKSPSPQNLIRFDIRTGRSFTTTPDHPVFFVENNIMKIKKALEIKKGDYFVIPKIELENREYQNIDLLVEFSQNNFESIWDKLMLRGINKFVKSLVDVKGLAETSKILKINKKTICNYYNKRDSVPFSLIQQLLVIAGKNFSDIPNCNVGFKGDHTSIKRILEVNKYFARLVGYYIAEGFYREDNRCHQVDLAVTEKDIRDDMIESIKNVFGEDFKPYQDKNRITIGSHIIYLVFKEIFKLANTARTKRIPSQFLQLPLPILAHLISAYFAGDGSVDANHPEVNCTSYSRELTRDIDTALLRFGIFSSLSANQRENDNIEYKIRLFGENIKNFTQKVGFTSKRKTENQLIALQNLNEKEMLTFGENKIVPVHKIEIIPAQGEYVYSIHAKDHHSILINENIVTHQCDGDEDGLMLLMEMLLNFSREYLPSKIGGKMDAPLVTSVILDPNEVDAEAQNVDTIWEYPETFYDFAQKFGMAPEFAKQMKLAGSRLKKPEQYEGFGFTHPTSSINAGPRITNYKRLESMEEKIEAQLKLARIILANDAKDIVVKILQSHFSPDIAGNMRAFATQEMRCSKCNEKYRRLPLTGKCGKCGAKLLLTVTKGGITKYLPIASRLAKEYDLSHFTQEKLELWEEYIKSLTDNGKIKQRTLMSFF